LTGKLTADANIRKLEVEKVRYAFKEELGVEGNYFKTGRNENF
jgi:hypothetical protein